MMKYISILTLMILGGSAFADSTISDINKHSYSANGGWTNWKWSSTPTDGAVVGESNLSGFIYSANFGWIHLGNGTPANGHTYSQSNGEFGVNHNGTGVLTGLAYGSNIGWINFDWATGNNPNEPKIDLSTGKFSGFAYGANVGWIKLDASASAFLETDTLQSPDTDKDGIADWWERQNSRSLTRYNATSDRDGDGATDLDEYFALTDPEDASSYLLAKASYSTGSTSYTITFPSNPGRRYAIQTGTNLITWPDSGLGVFSPDSGNSTTKVVTIPGSSTEVRRFFRVVASRPL